MKRIFSLILILSLAFTLFACAPDNIIEPVTPEQNDEEGSDPVSDLEQTDKDTETETDVDESYTGYVNPNKALNENIMPTADIDKLGLSTVKTSDLNGKELTFYTPERNAFSAGKLSELEWFDAIGEHLGVNINYTLRADGTLYSSQAIAQKAGLKLDIVSALVSGTAPARSLMKQALSLTGAEQNLPFSRRVFDLSGGKLFTGLGNSKMMWYNTDIVSDSKAYDYFTKGEWTNLTLDFLSNDVKDADKKMIECGNWAAFGSAGGVQATGLSADGSFVINLDNENVINSFSAFSKILDTVSDKTHTFKNGGTAFCYTDAPELDKGGLSFVPIPAYYGIGQCVTELSGVGMGVSATADDATTPYALTFALLWSARYSEARTDALLFEYKLTPQKANTYIEFTETYGGMYNADRTVSSYFESDTIDKALFADPTLIVPTFQSAYDRVAVINSRNQ